MYTVAVLLTYYSKYLFFAIPILAFLLPQTAASIVKVCLLIALFAAMKFFTAESLTAAILFSIYVGAIAILFLLAIISLDQLRWKVAVRGWYPNMGVIITTLINTYLAYACLVEIKWITFTTRVLPTYQIGGKLSTNTPIYNKQTAADALIGQAIGFTEQPVVYLSCAFVLLIGMLIVIDLLSDPETITKYVEKTKKTNKKWF